MVFSDGILPGQPYPSFAPEQCAVSACAARSEHEGLQQVRLLGGRHHPAVDTVIRLGLCHVHAATSHTGLEVHQLTHAATHTIAEAALCSVHRCHDEAEDAAALRGRLLGGYQYSPIDLTFELGLCHAHSDSSQNGLHAGAFTPPRLG